MTSGRNSSLWWVQSERRAARTKDDVGKGPLPPHNSELGATSPRGELGDSLGEGGNGGGRWEQREGGRNKCGGAIVRTAYTYRSLHDHDCVSQRMMPMYPSPYRVSVRRRGQDQVGLRNMAEQERDAFKWP